MKKILFLLLLSVTMYGQVPADATPLENIQITNNATDNSATKVNVQSTDGTINTISKSDLVNVIEVNDVPSLPLIGEVGKIYVVSNVNKIYRWNGTFYQELAVTDISGKENSANKQNSLAVDGTGVKYPTVDAINAIIVNETTGNFSSIQTLINSHPNGTVINLKPNTIYNQDNSLILKEGNVINGNGATLKRNTQQTTTTTIEVNETSTSITVSSVPVGWKSGDYLQLYTDDTFLTSSRKYEVIIQSIAGNVITLSQPIGAPAQGTTYTWAIGTTTVRKVFSQITAARSYDLFTQPTNFVVNNLIIDGNYTQNAGNFYWGVNMAVQNNGRSNFTNVTIKDIPNECFFGSGFTITNSTLTNSNGSFLHQSADITVGNFIFGGSISGNTTINTNIKNSVTVTGHSEGVITFSFSSGRSVISNNRFLGGGGSVLGSFQGTFGGIDGSNKDLIFVDNFAKDFTSVIFDFNNSVSFVDRPDNTLITKNIFSNCGSSNWSTYASAIAAFGTIKFDGNVLTNGTSISNIPTKMFVDYYGLALKANLSGGNTFNGNQVFNGIVDIVNSSSPLNESLTITGGKGLKISGTGGAIDIISTLGVNDLSTAINFKNDQAVKKMSLIAGKEGVTQEGIGFVNRTDGTYDFYVQNGNASVLGTVTATSFNGSATLTGTPTAPTATAGTNTTQIATTAFVQANVGASAHWTKTGNDIRNNNTGEVEVKPNSKLSILNASNVEVSRMNNSGSFISAVNSQGFFGSDGASGMSFDGSTLNFKNFGASTFAFNPIYTSSNIFGGSPTGIYNIIGFTNQLIAPTGGSVVTNMINFSPTINQTGGANGITRSIYINPTLTSAFDYRAIEVTAGKTVLQETKTLNLTVSNLGGGPSRIVSADVNGELSASSVFTHDGQIAVTNSVTANSFIKSGGTSSQFLKADGSVDESDYVKIIAKEATPGANITGTVSETILYSKLIPANTFKDGDFMTLISRIGKDGVDNTLAQRVRINTSNTLAGSKVLALNVLTASIKYGSLNRYFTISNNFITGHGISNISSDQYNTTVAPAIQVFNPAVDNYIFITGQLSNSADTMYHLGTKITN